MALNLDTLRRQVAEVGRAKAERATAAMTADLKRTAPRGQTGELQRKTGAEVLFTGSTLVRGLAIIDVEYGAAVARGSKPHVILPVNGRALKFFWPKKGAVVYFGKVNHPGTTANPFFDKIVARWADYLRR